MIGRKRLKTHGVSLNDLLNMFAEPGTSEEDFRTLKEFVLARAAQRLPKKDENVLDLTRV